MNDAEAAVAVAHALRIGYRLVDTAENYQNEAGVGEGVRKSGVPRPEVFVTTKFNKEWHSIEGVRAACEASLKRLGLDYIDLLLVHWPNPAQDRYVEAFQGLTRVLEAGLVRSIGVSNFKPAHLQRLFDLGLTPHVNQIQIDPYHRRDDLDTLDKARGIATESWSPLGRGGALLADPTVTAAAKAHNKTAGQIVLRWHIEHGYIPLPKSADPGRQAQNLAIFDFELTAEQRKALDSLGRPDPEMFDADVFGH
jgi:2,5-diketo-D-gluconate reductase A